eukprot:TRINITY_DN326_c0_g1_i3.p3 TRINITY_DN326_c0_g1~~TRINITY_DN326_c0_g1_i3.p3  ORF type:complete len:115 (+),score=1.89 TRINITY_DN326_c0_g1_i3:645-989(+)
MQALLPGTLRCVCASSRVWGFGVLTSCALVSCVSLASSLLLLVDGAMTPWHHDANRLGVCLGRGLLVFAVWSSALLTRASVTLPQTFMCTTSRGLLEDHVQRRHDRRTFDECFD